MPEPQDQFAASIASEAVEVLEDHLLQYLFVGSHCLARTTLRYPYIRKSDCAPNCIGNIPDHMQVSHALGKRPVCYLEISTRPNREP
jgi:hypothetical protein